ncbi:hypothetical protein HDG35_001390 [Paraburkholderia sp. JPY681]|nr:hypothetical protein [Paraburkholderia atlantica]
MNDNRIGFIPAEGLISRQKARGTLIATFL